MFTHRESGAATEELERSQLPQEDETSPSAEEEAAGDDEDTEEDEENEPLRKVLKERMVDIRSMSAELKVFVAVSALVLVALAVLSLTRNDHLGTLVTSSAFSDEDDKSASMTQILFAASVLFVCLGWALVVTAAARAGWLTRLATLGALGLAFGTERVGVTYINLSTTLIAAAICGVVVAIVTLSWFPERETYHEQDPLVLRAKAPWKTLRKLVFPLSFLLFLTLYGLVWQESRAVGYADNFPQTVADQLSNIQWLLIPIITLAGADFGDWGNFAAMRAIHRLGTWTSERVLTAIAVVAAGAVAADGIRVAYSDNGSGIVNELALGAIVAVVAGFLLVVAKPRDQWPSTYPFVVPVVCVVVDTVVAYILSVVVTNDPDGTKSDGWEALAWLGFAVIGVLMLTVGRRKLPASVMVGAVFATLVGVVYTFTDLDSVSSVIHPFGWTPDTAPWLGYEGLKAVAGIVTIAVIVVAMATRKLQTWAQPIRLLLSMTIALQILTWIDSLYGGAVHQSGAAAVTGQLALAAAVVLVLALSWEFATSGESVTNGHRRRFPRDSRVMLFLGYVVITATTSVFFSSIGEVDDGKWHLLESQFEAENWVRDGLLFLGAPLVITIFIVAFNRWRQERALEPETEQPPQLEAAGAPTH